MRVLNDFPLTGCFCAKKDGIFSIFAKVTQADHGIIGAKCVIDSAQRSVLIEFRESFGRLFVHALTMERSWPLSRFFSIYYSSVLNLPLELITLSTSKVIYFKRSIVRLKNGVCVITSRVYKPSADA